MFPYFVLYVLFGFMFAMWSYAVENPSDVKITDNYDCLFTYMFLWPLIIGGFFVCLIIVFCHDAFYMRMGILRTLKEFKKGFVG